MQLEVRKYLYDIDLAVARILEFTAGKQFEDYQREAMVRSAVERQFEIIGEALSKVLRLDSTLASRISEHSRIVAFRNILIHGYAEVDSRLVWDVVQAKLPTLKQEIGALLAE
jgi:uncharacterized protein with HEPN domain